MIILWYERLQAWKSHRLGLQVPSGVDDEVQVSGIGRGRGSALSRVAARDSDQQGDDDLCRFNQSWSCPYAYQYTAAVVGIPSGAVSEGLRVRTG